MPQVEFEAPTAKRRGPTVLIVDDEEGLRELMREALECKGYCVLEARSGLEALETMEHQAIDLLITDHGLPGLSGSEMVNSAAKAHPGLQVLYISGYEQDPRRDGAHPFLAKPFTADALATMVQGLLGKRAGVSSLGPDAPPPQPVAHDEADPSREETDESLRTERHAADDAGQVVAAQDNADRVVDLARERADAILTEAREKADQGSQGPGTLDDVAKDRADADEVLQDERASADESLRLEREDSARLLSAFLSQARESTDWMLLTERASSDAALAYRSDFLGMVSHDLNNLLAGIVLSTGMLSKHSSETPDGKRIAAGTHRIQLYAARMKRLIGDLTDVTSLAAGKLAVTPAPNDGSALVAEAIATFRSLAAEKGISLAVEIPDGPLRLLCDRGRILQVLANILGNAIKFTPAGGSVSASAERQGDEVRFSVTDTGPGIPEHLLQAVFERFWQAGKDDRRGLGLGLYIARSIVEAHSGRIWAERRVGGGSVFHFTLPIGVPLNPAA